VFEATAGDESRDTIFLSLIRLPYQTNGRDLKESAKEVERNRGIANAVRKEQRRLFDFIRKRVRTEEDAEDILQDVYYQLISSYSVTEPIEKLTSWLFTVARNKIIDWYRKRKPDPAGRRRSHGELEDDDVPGMLEETLIDPDGSPDDAYARSLVWGELEDALEDLPGEQRMVFIMHELEGRSFKEIAQLTGQPVNTLLSRKRYAVLSLRERLEELYDEFQQL